jgi:hypothetical protein
MYVVDPSRTQVSAGGIGAAPPVPVLPPVPALPPAPLTPPLAPPPPVAPALPPAPAPPLPPLPPVPPAPQRSPAPPVAAVPPVPAAPLVPAMPPAPSVPLVPDTPAVPLVPAMLLVPAAPPAPDVPPAPAPAPAVPDVPAAAAPPEPPSGAELLPDFPQANPEAIAVTHAAARSHSHNRPTVHMRGSYQVAFRATTATGTASLKLDGDPLGSQFLNDLADAVVRARADTRAVSSAACRTLGSGGWSALGDRRLRRRGLARCTTAAGAQRAPARSEARLACRHEVDQLPRWHRAPDTRRSRHPRQTGRRPRG